MSECLSSLDEEPETRRFVKIFVDVYQPFKELACPALALAFLRLQHISGDENKDCSSDIVEVFNNLHPITTWKLREFTPAFSEVLIEILHFEFVTVFEMLMQNFRDEDMEYDEVRKRAKEIFTGMRANGSLEGYLVEILMAESASLKEELRKLKRAAK